MRSVVVWADKVHDRDGVQQCIYTVAFKPDGTQLIAAAGNRVLVYETADGELIASLKGHKDTVYSVAYSPDGKLFASGAADKTVIIWTNELQGKLKFSHTDAIQALAFNPTSLQLASCTATDFGFWSEDAKAVNKFKSNSRINTCSWTNDGQYLALGLFNGNVSIRNRSGDEKVVIQRPNGGPVWSLQWNPSPKEKTDVLAVTDWNQTLSFYMLSGREVLKERKLDFDPCCVSHFSTGEFMVLAGSNKQASLYTKEGVFLANVAQQEGWVWCCAVRPKQNYVVIGCHDGTIALHQLIFSTVHGLYKDRYAYRKDMTDVIIQDLSSEVESRIRCRDLVKKIAIYQDRLAVQLPNQVNIYELYHDSQENTKARVIEKIRKKFECNLLVVCASHVILCQERRLQSFSFDGTKEKEWVLDSLIRYIKVTGGPPGREGLLVGLKNGLIVKIFVDNAFPMELIKQQTAVRCLDLSPNRKKLAVVDDNNTCLVYDLGTKDLLFQEPHANSVVFNTQNEDMLCFSGGGMLHIKAAQFPLHQQKLQGFVVGFNGSYIYCLHVYAMNRVEVPQSQSMFQYLRDKQFAKAYEVACLGVTEADWRALALEALEGLQLDVAKKSFIRVRDLNYLDLIYQLEEKQARGDLEEELVLAEVHAYQGRFAEAAKLFAESGHGNKAMEMYIALRQFDKAKEYMSSSDPQGVKHLMTKQAEWCKSTNDPSIAIDILSAAGEDMQSVDIMGENGMHQKLIDKARQLNKAEVEVLRRIAHWLRKLDQVPLAAEVYSKIGDQKRLVELFVESHRWQDALALAQRSPELTQEVYVPYANYLAETDRYQEAQEAFRAAGQEQKAIEVLEVLTHNAVLENRFDDAATYFWQLGQSAADALAAAASEDDISESSDPDDVFQAKMDDYLRKAELYHAYHGIQRYIDEPFTSHMPESLFNMARFLLQQFRDGSPNGISRVYTLFALAKQSRNLGAFKLARTAYEKLQALKVPESFREHVDLGCVTIRSKPFVDSEDVIPMCYRCSTLNPLLGVGSNACSNCSQPFVLSFHTFEVLPLVEFFLDIDISDGEAVRLIQDDSGVRGSGGWSEKSAGSAQVLSMDDGEEDEFTKKLMQFSGTGFEPVRVDRAILQSLRSTNVLVQRWSPPLPYRYFCNVMPETAVSMCDSCWKFFHADDYEDMILQHGCCPFCKTPKTPSGDSVKKTVSGLEAASSSA
eukprot:m.484376 g.484376  ORF g.484376 m.484376 type:complete len:1206 (+) comp23337_c0_seq1:143-3760(+)